jgi:DnaK suppressor protein
MKLSEQERFRPVVEAAITELKAQLSIEDSTTEPVKPDNAIGRLSRVDAMQQQQMSLELKRQRQARLSRLERALTLIDDGEYGTCPRCEDDIAMKRLEAVPDAIFCFDCANAVEQAD